MSITLQQYRGSLALVGSDINNLVTSALATSNIDASNFSPSDPTTYHVTLVSKDELRKISPEKVTAVHVEEPHVFSLGIGGQPRTGVYWVVIIWAAGQQIRKQLGLPPKHFHITLSSNDVHNVDKGAPSLLAPSSLDSLPTEVLDHLIFTFQSFGQFSEAKEHAVPLILRDRTSHKGFLRFADAAFGNKEHKMAMMSYACAWEHATDNKLQSYCLKKLADCSKETEWGQVFQEHEIAQLDANPEIASTLLTPWSSTLRETLSNQTFAPTLLLEPRNPLYIPSPQKALAFYKLPRFFRWLIPSHLAIMSTPRNEDDIIALASPPLGIRHILTLTEETPLPESWFRGKKITNTFLPIPNYHPPSIEQMDLIMSLFDDHEKLPLLVHCGGGKGRAGTVAACYLAACGFGKPSIHQDHPEMSAPDAISTLRSLRPGSLETSQQEAFVSTWCSTLWKRQSIYPDLPSEPPPCPLEIEGTGRIEDADLLVLVGLPGSGKSWFSKSLMARDPDRWVYISQDESRSRSTCENQIGRSPRGKRVILDRCNMSNENRKEWLALASNWCVSPVIVWFDYEQALCVSRAQMRANHPTLPPGGRVRSAVEQMQKKFVRPTVHEAGVGSWKAVVIIRSFQASQEAVLRLSSPVGIYKFPRTPHLINVGAATDDDLHTDVAAFASAATASDLPLSESTVPRVVITEKIDGANMGFSLSSNRERILVQNRSHHVNPSTHEQFKKLGSWIAAHEEGLRSILDRDPFFAERYILFGEWLYATHSIPYTQLPDWFMAYDLYDRSTKTFLDRRGLEALLEGTKIAAVPTVNEGDKMPTKEELLKMIQRHSMFYEGRVEGVYVKVEEKGVVKLRGKVVRSDFIAGNDHWTRGGVKMNGLKVMVDGDVQ